MLIIWEKALLKKERFELKNFPEKELEELTTIYEKRGLSPKTAAIVAKELTDNDPIDAHFDAELRIDPANLTNPWHAAFASAAAFLMGAVIPLIAIVLPPEPLRIPIAFVSVIIALVITGTLSAKIGGANATKDTIRVVTGGILAMVVTYAVGYLFGVSGL